MYANVKAEIVEQPDSKPMRFRYESEGPMGSIPGANSTDVVKTCPAIRILNYDGRAVVFVSCVTDESTPKPHPNYLSGPKNCIRHGIYKADITTESAAPTVVELRNVGVFSVKRALIRKYLNLREELRIDPFKTGFEHKHHPTSIDMHRFRFCFQVYLKPDANNPKHLVPLKPIVSNVMIDKTQSNILNILEISDVSSPAEGGKLIMILIDKVDRNDLVIKFYEKDSAGRTVWEELVRPSKVHKQCGISFLTPRYRMPSIDRRVNVFFRLQTLEDETTLSDEKKFHYVPDPLDIARILKYDSRLSYDSMEINGVDDCQRNRNSMGNAAAACTENIDPRSDNFGVSNFNISINNVSSSHPLQPQQNDSFYPQRQYEPQYHSQPLLQQHFTSSQYQEPAFYQQQYQRVGQTQIEMYSNDNEHRTPGCSPYTGPGKVDNVYGVANNFSGDNNLNNFDFCQHALPTGNYDAPIEPTYSYDENEMPFTITNNQENSPQTLTSLADFCLTLP